MRLSKVVYWVVVVVVVVVIYLQLSRRTSTRHFSSQLTMHIKRCHERVSKCVECRCTEYIIRGLTPREDSTIRRIRYDANHKEFNVSVVCLHHCMSSDAIH